MLVPDDSDRGCFDVDRQLLRLFLRRYRGNLVLVGIASLLLNVLVFAGSGYMMLVYDSVCRAEASPRWPVSSRCWC
jgi:ATP-binding cassette subfamily C protein